MTNFKDFFEVLITENLHPELYPIIDSNDINSRKSKQTAIVNKIKDLTNRGEETGLEKNMPKGSSRMYLPHTDMEELVIDGQTTKLKVGTKVAIRSKLDPYHEPKNFNNLSLGAMQNKVEGGDNMINDKFRILTENNNHEFETNSQGILPPLINHDYENHEWTKVGHVNDIKSSDWKRLTKTPEFPKGITHKEFTMTLNRFHRRGNGLYWHEHDYLANHDQEKDMDRLEKHPLIKKFMDYHGLTSHPTYDYEQMKNLGIWKHPITGEEHIVARDHGFDNEVSFAYQRARRKKSDEAKFKERFWG